ncbi:MAG: N-acetylneuraminate synthase family protein [Candidatus Omnitrophica bacterium]|nr:N-acetylneuraminate synthase family protein [Candidatus Omnitrophota bacterium]
MAQKVIKVADHTIGEGSPVFMIAEIGINHNGNLDIAKRLIDAAFACNWDCVKFQKRTPEICVPEHQKGVMRDTPWGRMTYLEYRHKVEFGDAEYSYIDRYCKEKPLAWTASIWDLPSLDFILKYDISFIKIPSAKLTDKELIGQACRVGKPVILSTGMSTIEEVDEAVEVLEKYSKGNYVIMHTNSTYPTPAAEVNLRVIPLLQKRYGCIVGYSGHEYDLEPTVIASVLGAKVVERHITLDHGMWGSDHAASLEVHAMNMLYKRIKDIDMLLGDGVKRITEKELEIRKKLK